MILALFIIAILWIVIGTFLILYTEGTMGVLKKLFFIEKVRLLAILPIIFGVVLIACALAFTKIFWVSCILGLLALIKGVYFTIGPLPHIRGIIDWWFNRSSGSAVYMG